MHFAIGLNSVRFITPVEVFQVTSNGGTFNNDRIGLQIEVPPGAISSGSVLSLEVGMCLFGPIEYPESSIPISPILLLHAQQDIPLQKPVYVTLPHNISLKDTQNLDIHVLIADCEQEELVPFNFYDIEKEEFSTHVRNGQGYATFSLSHFCFISLGVGIEKERDLKRSCCICPLMQTASTWPRYFKLVLVYNMKPCMEVS